ncbi:WSSV615 [White spot syndrome virus]|uniref:WSSV615 n=1 Tax=White spot syndrome virus TaxID=342409 RepID=A0A2I6SCN0_9VIRU|nr:WSSV615 [White spot syndrome virus]
MDCCCLKIRTGCRWRGRRICEFELRRLMRWWWRWRRKDQHRILVHDVSTFFPISLSGGKVTIDGTGGGAISFSWSYCSSPPLQE